MSQHSSEVSTRVSTAALPPLPALVVGRVEHERYGGHAHSFNYRHYQWLIDLDHPPRWRGGWRLLTQFRGEDHLVGAPGLHALKANVLRVVNRHGVATTGAEQVVMLAHARSFGHVFDPMSAFFVFAASGRLAALVVEVHNTYRGRHAYVVHPDADGTAHIKKEFYVSPFNDAHGEYQFGVWLQPDQLRVQIELFRHDKPVIKAVTYGKLVPATRRALTRTAVTHPFMTYQVSALIRRHGVGLWARRLPVQTRPEGANTAHNKESVA